MSETYRGRAISCSAYHFDSGSDALRQSNKKNIAPWIAAVGAQGPVSLILRACAMASDKDIYNQALASAGNNLHDGAYQLLLEDRRARLIALDPPHQVQTRGFTTLEQRARILLDLVELSGESLVLLAHRRVWAFVAGGHL